MAILAEIRAVISTKEARLMLVRDGNVVEDEVWAFVPSIERKASVELSKTLFDDLYDFLNVAANGE